MKSCCNVTMFKRGKQLNTTIICGDIQHMVQWQSDHPLSSNNLVKIGMFIKLLFVISYILFYLLHVCMYTYVCKNLKIKSRCSNFLCVFFFLFLNSTDTIKYPSGSFNFTLQNAKSEDGNYFTLLFDKNCMFFYTPYQHSLQIVTTSELNLYISVQTLLVNCSIQKLLNPFNLNNQK